MALTSGVDLADSATGGFVTMSLPFPSVACFADNTLTHLGTPIKVLYDDPDGHDRLFRYNESIQEFFNLSAKLDLDLSA
jgi:hypothetical protein